MRRNLKKFLKQCHRLGYVPVVKRAPDWVVTFDRMVVVFFDKSRQGIRAVHLYDSRTDELRSA